MDVKQFTAMKAFIIYDGKVLLLRENKKYSDGTNIEKYDVPGGRVNPGEHFMESLVREIKEETGLTVNVKHPFFVNEWRPQVRGEQWHIIGTFLVCEADTNSVVLSQDHDHHEWILPEEHGKYHVIPNLRKAFEAYLERK
jgi:8-oxo-dGTP diphosphatase